MNFDIARLQELINNNNFNEAIDIINEIGSARFNEAVPFLIKHLKETDNAVLRNSIALALSDIGNQEAVESIIEMLKHPKTKGRRGTLLAALEPFDYSPHLNLLIEFVFEGNFEVSRKSFLLVESIIKKIPNEVIEECIMKTQEKVEDLENKLEFATEFLEMLEQSNR